MVVVNTIIFFVVGFMCDCHLAEERKIECLEACLQYGTSEFILTLQELSVSVMVIICIIFSLHFSQFLFFGSKKNIYFLVNLLKNICHVGTSDLRKKLTKLLNKNNT